MLMWDRQVAEKIDECMGRFCGSMFFQMHY